jgi:hypothetical protein
VRHPVSEEIKLNSKLIYRIASVLLLLFADGHTLGFRKTPPQWGVDALVASMRAIHFNAQGFDRTYYDFYVGFGLFVSVLQLFAGLVAWQLGGLSREVLRSMPILTWGMVLCFGCVTILSWKYFFVVPVVFSAALTLCLLPGAWLVNRT